MSLCLFFFLDCIETPKRNGCKEHWKKSKPIVLGLIFLVITFAPAILPNLILNFLTEENVFVFYQIEGTTSNELRILQVCISIMNGVILEASISIKTVPEGLGTNFGMEETIFNIGDVKIYKETNKQKISIWGLISVRPTGS